MLVLALAVSVIYAIIGWGGILVFGFGSNAKEAYFLMYPFLSLLIFLVALFSLRLMAVLLLADFICAWLSQIIGDWPHWTGLNLFVLGIAAYLLFPKRVRSRGVIGAVSQLSSEQEEASCG